MGLGWAFTSTKGPTRIISIKLELELELTADPGVPQEDLDAVDEMEIGLVLTHHLKAPFVSDYLDDDGNQWHLTDILSADYLED